KAGIYASIQKLGFHIYKFQLFVSVIFKLQWVKLFASTRFCNSVICLAQQIFIRYAWNFHRILESKEYSFMSPLIRIEIQYTFAFTYKISPCQLLSLMAGNHLR